MDDQLFKYATWRDSKLAVIVFNRNKNFTDVMAKARVVLANHPQIVRQELWEHLTGSRYIFKRADDPQRLFYLTLLAFDILAP